MKRTLEQVRNEIYSEEEADFLDNEKIKKLKKELIELENGDV
jgi:hypothetical protein